MTTESCTAMRVMPADAEIDLAFEALYRFLAAALSDPCSNRGQLTRDVTAQRCAQAASELLRDHFDARVIPLGYGELPVEELDLAPLLAGLRESPEQAQTDYQRVFGLITCRECPPYETEYHKNEDTFFRSQQMADVAGFYCAFGVAPTSATRERPDHLGLELEYLALLLMKSRLAEAADDAQARDQQATCQAAYTAFFRDHVSWWAPAFSLALRRKAESGVYAELGRALAALLPLDRTRQGVPAPMTPLEPKVLEAPDECDGCLPDVVELKI